MKIAIQINDYKSLGKTTEYIAKEAINCKHPVFFYQTKNLRLYNKGVFATGRLAKTSSGNIYLQEDINLELDSFDIILMRNDPPFDGRYITATYILERCKATVINDPKSVRNWPEKFVDYKEETFDTLITEDIFAIEEFCKKHKSFIIKPLYEFGGSNILKFKDFNKDTKAQIEKLIIKCQAPIVVQEFCKEVLQHGDKRVVILDGKILGYFKRTNDGKNFIVNMCQGGKPQICTLTKKEHYICQKIAYELKRQKIVLAGIDLINQKITEINTSSIAGVIELSDLYKFNAAKTCLDAFLNYLK